VEQNTECDKENQPGLELRRNEFDGQKSVKEKKHIDPELALNSLDSEYNTKANYHRWWVQPG
jgi:hypothetical protein